MMSLRFVYFFLNLLLIICILIRNPNEQSFQETLQFLNVFDNFNEAENFFDRLILYLVIIYFSLGFFLGITIS